MMMAGPAQPEMCQNDFLNTYYNQFVTPREPGRQRDSLVSQSVVVPSSSSSSPNLVGLGRPRHVDMAMIE